MVTGNSDSAIFYITAKGKALSQKLKALYPDAKVSKFQSELIPDIWNESKTLIFIMATGIVVRTIAPFIKDKKTDPAVVVLDEDGKFVISLLSGHIGGANAVAKEIAGFLNTEAVITTASDVNNLPAVDLWAKENNLIIENWDTVPLVSTRLLNKGALNVYTETDLSLPDEFSKVADPKTADILITRKERLNICGCHIKGQLYLRPKNLVIGMGFNSRTTAGEIEDSIKKVLHQNNLSFLSIHSLATIDRKAGEKGLVAFARKYGFAINAFSPGELNSVKGITKSEAVFKATGAHAVAEPSALLASKTVKLLVPKQKVGNVTVAVANIKTRESCPSSVIRKKNEIHYKTVTDYGHGGRIYIVGTGPGNIEHITPYARTAIKTADVIVGYNTYLDLITELTKGKEIISTGMTQEIERCKKAVELAGSGKTVAVISGGDPGIYAMAGLVFEILKNRNELCVMSDEIKDKKTSPITDYLSRIHIEVIPGISALNACAARLGAPLMHDFASISLSDRLTPWKIIEKRLAAASAADFVIVLYNPKSKGRVEHINKAVAIIQRYRKFNTPVGIVKSAMREGEKVIITDLKNLLNHEIDMQTTIIIGNSQTFVWNNRMVTPRGYDAKYKT
jgi:cobalt-precorrin 5A hydrolase/precorrin-3B C17-methyltransferase